MLNKLQNIPHSYIQVALINLGLIIALSKGYSLLYITFSLVVTILLVTMIAQRVFNYPSQETGQVIIFHEEVKRNSKKLVERVQNFLKKVKDEKDEGKKTTVLITALVVLYISLNFLCPCLETFIIVNGLYLYLFLNAEMNCLLAHGCEFFKDKCSSFGCCSGKADCKQE